MTQQFTASEVRGQIAWLRNVTVVGTKTTYQMLNAFADLLETQEKAVPVAWWNKRTGQILRPHELDAIPDARHPHSYFKNGFVPLTAHFAQAQPPAASVPGVSAQAHENAQAALAAQGTPMNDLETLRPEVAEAVAWLKSGVRPGTRSFDGWSVIRAELLRLADENAIAKAEIRTLRNAACDFAERAEQAEAELAAMEARIAEAPTAIVGRCALNSSPEYNIVTACSPLDGKRVRLVVEN